MKTENARQVPALGIVVVHFGSVEPTLECLRSALPQLEEGDHLLVVDNSPVRPDSGTAAAELSSLLPSGIHYLPCPDNPGFGEGANRGVGALRSIGPCQRWLILNNDVELLPGFLDAARQPLPETCGAAAGPQYLDRDCRQLWYAGGRVIPWLGLVRQSTAIADASRSHEVSFLPGSALLVPDPAWTESGGFDPAFFLYHEDLDLCLRLRALGWHLWFIPGLRCIHRVGGTTGSLGGDPLYLELMARSRFQPWPSLAHRIFLALLHTPIVLARALLGWLQGTREGRVCANALLRGHLAALRSLRARGEALRKAAPLEGSE